MTTIPKKYDFKEAEIRIQQFWVDNQVYAFSKERVSSVDGAPLVNDGRPVYAIDTPPPTVSGNLHLGHLYSYSQAEFMARYWRMQGYNVYYPMGYDDNGLATERLVENRRQIRAQEVGREAFVRACLELSREIKQDYEAIWKRLGLSIDWRYTYSTIDDWSRRTSQWSFIDLYRRGLVYHASAPTIWNPVMQTAIAQAELDDLERETLFVTISFRLEDGSTLPIATTRPELLPACVAIFVHPEDERFTHLVGGQAFTPLFERAVPILADEQADPTKGTGAVMCCTFGDVTDIDWWRQYRLPLIGVIERDGRLNQRAGEYAGLSVVEARERIIADLKQRNLLSDEQRVTQTIRVHERDDTPVEYIETNQWFVKVLAYKERLLAAGRAIRWVPQEMQTRYENWVQGLAWDWAISRQRYFGVPFPLWYCDQCGEIIMADDSQLPVDPLETGPLSPCPKCGSDQFTPEADVMDTWATSSLTPQIAGRWLAEPALYQQVFPMNLRPQAHDIIRTWAFYTIAKSLYHFDQLPWRTVAISGHGLSPVGAKLSKSRGNGQATPLEAIEHYSADAIRYWAAGAGFGRDSWISEEQFKIGQKLMTKLWNVFRFSMTFLHDYVPEVTPAATLSPTDKWLLAHLQRTIQGATAHLEAYDFARALAEVEDFFWNILADNYIEMAKYRLYSAADPTARDAARYSLYQALLSAIKLFAPVMPHLTEEIYQRHFAQFDGAISIHRSSWPQGEPTWAQAAEYEAFGADLVAIATAVRRFKSHHQRSLGSEFAQLVLVTDNEFTKANLNQALDDVRSVTRAKEVVLQPSGENGLEIAQVSERIGIGIVA
jgi:valyl-tRNA synthetase